jgi:hypothetical protein
MSPLTCTFRIPGGPVGEEGAQVCWHQLHSFHRLFNSHLRSGVYEETEAHEAESAPTSTKPGPSSFLHISLPG